MKKPNAALVLFAAVSLAALLVSCGFPAVSSEPAASSSALAATGGEASAPNIGPDSSEPEAVAVEITTVDDFLAIQKDMGAVYVLVADLDISSVAGQLPLGNSDTPFTGTLDGAGHSLSGLGCEGETKEFALFSRVEGTVQDLALRDVSMRSEQEAGAKFAGIALTNAGTIENCLVSGSMDNTFIAGGIAVNNSGMITGCSSSVTFVSGITVGGIVCSNATGAEVSGCTFAGDIQSAYHESKSDAGGIAATNSGNISDSVFKGTLSLENREYISTAGGIAGQNTGGITNCANLGSVRGSHEVGGIVGANNSGSSSAIRSCYSSGDVTVYHDNVEAYAGGIAGYNYGLIVDCFHAGTVSGQGFLPITGGLAGVCHSVGSMQNCHNVGAVSGGAVGAVAGYMWSKKIENVYYLNSGGGIGSRAGDGEEAQVTALSAEQMGDPGFFVGFDFEAIWEMDSFPVLQGIGYAPKDQ